MILYHRARIAGHVKDEGFDDRTLVIFGVLQPLQSIDSLSPNFGHFVLQPFEHVVIDLLVQFVVNFGFFTKKLQKAVDEHADFEASAGAFNFVMIQKPVKKSA